MSEEVKLNFSLGCSLLHHSATTLYIYSSSIKILSHITVTPLQTLCNSSVSEPAAECIFYATVLATAAAGVVSLFHSLESDFSGTPGGNLF